MNYTNCPRCDSDNIDDSGWEDGLGEFGDDLCQMWFCNSCGHEWEGDCVEDIDDEN